MKNENFAQARVEAMIRACESSAVNTTTVSLEYSQELLIDILDIKQQTKLLQGIRR